MDALKYITKKIPAAAPVTEWLSFKLFPQYKSLGNLYNNPLYLQASDFIQGQWLIEHDLSVLGLSSRTAFDSLCCYSVSPEERLYYLTDYYYKKIKDLFAHYESVAQSSDCSWLTKRQRDFLNTQMSELSGMIAEYEERLASLEEYALPPEVISFYQSFGTDLRLLFIFKLKDKPGSAVWQSLPALQSPGIRHFAGHAATLKKLQQCHEKPEAEPISPTSANKPPLRFMSQKNRSDKRNRSNQQFGSGW